MTMKKLFLAAMLFSTTALAKGTLDGKVFTVDSAEKGKTSTEKDDVDFANGKLHSKGCDQWGFGAGAYKTDGNKFEADTTSAKEGKIHWSGTVVGDKIEGTYVWTKAGQKPIEYGFKGTLKK
jgi:hypothetical protein